MHSTHAVQYDFEDSYAVQPAKPASEKGSAQPYDYGEVSLAVDGQVQRGLNLFLPLKDPAQFGALNAALIAKTPETQKALRELHYVHFARFVPTPDYSTLMVITEYDGDLRSYVMDFVAVLGDVFTAILEFVKDAPPLPVKDYPEEFWAFVQAHNMDLPVWSAYPHMTVIDILRARRAR
jgi:hypothetical protein